MANDVIPTPDQRAVRMNGAPGHESVVDRAKRILGGDIRPDDYLALPAEAAAKVEWEFEMALQQRPGAVLTETEKLRIRQNRALEFHYGGRWVLTLRKPEGVIAFGSGEEAITRLSRDVPEEFQSFMRFEYPMPWE